MNGSIESVVMGGGGREVLHTREMGSIREYFNHFAVFCDEADGVNMPLSTADKVSLYSTYCQTWGMK